MSLLAFQQAIADLTLSPRQVRRILRGDLSHLHSYDLTERELSRILDVVRQPGMAVNCTVARGNRFEAIGELFPMTCVVLEPVLRNLLDELWEDVVPANYQFAEEEAFAAIVRRKMANNELSIEYLEEIFTYELVCSDLAKQMRSQTDTHHEAERIVEFCHPPDLLLPPLSELNAPPPGLPSGIYRARVILRETRFDVEMLSATPDSTAASRPN
jgi:hypothetical protein